MPTTLTLSKEAVNEAIMAFEISWSKETGFATYNKKYRKPVVPAPDTTDSGVTVGVGYDCGQYSAEKIVKDWSSVIPLDQAKALAKTAGLKKQKAVQALNSIKHISIPIDCALQVFYNNTIFSFAKEALRIYPNLPNIHPVEQSVIVSIVYNRGSALEGHRRKEMKQLVTDIKNDNDKDMAATILAMCRLWPNVAGLVKRRKAEAGLILLPDLPLEESDKLYITL